MYSIQHEQNVLLWHGVPKISSPASKPLSRHHGGGTGGEAMKTKLLKHLRRIGRNKVTIYSVTRTNGSITGMSIGFDESCYRGLFKCGDDENSVRQKAARIYIKNYLKHHKQKSNTKELISASLLIADELIKQEEESRQ
jgi:hypothetical protein